MLPAVAALGPSVLAGAANLLGGMQQNAANRSMSREQMAFQERMSGSAYQRAVADMRLAGINPMLAADSGGASSPGGASAQMENVISPAVSSAQHATRLREEIQMMRTQNKLEIGKIPLQAMDLQLRTAERDKIMAETGVIRSGVPGRLVGPENVQRVRSFIEGGVKRAGEVPSTAKAWFNAIQGRIFGTSQAQVDRTLRDRASRHAVLRAQRRRAAAKPKGK